MLSGLRIPLAFVAAFVSACGGLDAVDHVHDLRMLAVRAEPPGQPIDPNALAVGAIANTTSTQQMTLTALVADPKGAGRSLDYSFATCSVLDTNTQRCLPNSVGYTVFNEGTAQSPNGYVEISTQFTPSDRQLVDALAQDTYHGFDGLLFPIQLTVQAGDEHVTGVKFVVYMPPYPGVTYTPNQNPNILSVTVENTPWPADGYTFTSSEQPKDGWVITPKFDAEAQVTYQVPSFDGKVLTFKENWLFDFFNTLAPGFAPTTTGGSQFVFNVPNPDDSKWKPEDTKETHTGLFYFVVRNGRGGENWMVLPATWQP